MKTKIIVQPIQSKETEIRTLLYTLGTIKAGFYQSNGFHLDVADNLSNPESAVFLTKPQLQFARDKLNWNNIDEKEVTLNWCELAITKYSIDARLINYEVTPGADILDQWKKHCDEITQFIDMIVDEPNEYKIKLFYKKIGTIASFDTTSKPNEFFIALREDATFGSFLYCLLSAILQIQFRHREWFMSQEIMNFIFESSFIKKLSPDYRMPFKVIQTESLPKIEQEKSKANFLAIGYPVNELFTIEENRLHMNGYGEVDFLSKSEKKLFTYLVLNKDKVITYEELSDNVWGEEYFSLESITKMVQRIREKLQLAGIRKQVIKTERNIGYYYSD
ncbi:winged helix-turn-helix domain-containing protein [Candidatus Dojkabacteria bacterium]|uniref:Winged helix-turn-helix domain-containing protein n=1 Tax=Candidatus Dojkabacteria bacterium TaxID=2099670 RepID=A0A955L3V7_9BACT|nr:winged helix-turn-helix domain-containing protein [Candidatus Dojkabacteria bacterium]